VLGWERPPGPGATHWKALVLTIVDEDTKFKGPLAPDRKISRGSCEGQPSRGGHGNGRVFAFPPRGLGSKGYARREREGELPPVRRPTNRSR
jgi:hypothetical protein